MSNPVEVLFMSDNNGSIQTINCVNPHTGTTLTSYKSDNGIAKETLSILCDSYLLAANPDKPLVHVWCINGKEPLSHLRMVVAGKVSALAVSSCGAYCIAGINCKLYIWNTSSGYLLKVLSRHSQPINKIIFFDSSTYFVTAGSDGLVLVWCLADVINRDTSDSFANCQPLYCFSQHSLPVTNMHLGHGNLNGRLFTVSADQTCKVFSLDKGQLLVSIVFDFILTSVVANDMETELFVGTNCGKILLFHLDPLPATFEHHVNDSTGGNAFTGHSKAVTFLSISSDGMTLASGGEDQKVLLWNISSKQVLRSFEMKGQITSLFFYIAASQIFEREFKPRVALSTFEKAGHPERSTLEINILVHEEIEPISTLKEFMASPKKSEARPVEGENEVNQLKSKISRLQQANKQLYKYAMRAVLKNPMAFGDQFSSELMSDNENESNCDKND